MMPEACNFGFREYFLIKLNKSLYILKLYRRMWYNYHNEYLLKYGYTIIQFIHVFAWKYLKVSFL